MVMKAVRGLLQTRPFNIPLFYDLVSCNKKKGGVHIQIVYKSSTVEQQAARCQRNSASPKQYKRRKRCSTLENPNSHPISNTSK